MQFTTITKEALKEKMDFYLELIRDWKYCTWTSENFLYELPRKWDYSFAVVENEQVVGFCIASGKISDAYYIHLFFVDPKHRNAQIGKKMLDHAAEISRKNNLNKIELRCPESNVKALQFYHRNGILTREIIQDATSGNEKDHYLQLKLN